MATRRAVVLACLALLSTGSLTIADEQADTRALVERAIDAAGGRAALARYKKPFIRLSAGTLQAPNGTTAFEVTLTALLPDKLRTDQSNANGVKSSILFDGTKGWTNTSGAPAARGAHGLREQPKVGPQAMREGGIELIRNAQYAQWLATLLPLLGDDVRLTKLDDLVIDERPVVGIGVTREDRPDVRLYFDKETLVLVKMARKAMTDQWFEEYYHNYKELDGLKYPTVVEQHFNGKKQTEMQTKELRFLDEVEEGTFDKP